MKEPRPGPGSLELWLEVYRDEGRPIPASDTDPKTIIKEVVPRIKGSHHYLLHKDDATPRTTVAMHSGDLPTRDVCDIFKQANISREEFLSCCRTRGTSGS